MKEVRDNLKTAIDVWSIYLPDHRSSISLYRSFLSSDETGRSGKFIRPADAEKFILCRGILRRILAETLNTVPERLRFSRSEQGKPFLESSGLEFNVSHSRERLLIAVTSGRTVGIDIEFQRRGPDLKAIAERWFSPAEQQFFASQQNPEAAFFEIWSKKEAYVKARGTGMFKEMSLFTVPLGVIPFSSTDGSGGDWIFQTLDIDPGYAAALVFAAPPVSVHLKKPCFHVL